MFGESFLNKLLIIKELFLKPNALNLNFHFFIGSGLLCIKSKLRVKSRVKQAIFLLDI